MGEESAKPFCLAEHRRKKHGDRQPNYIPAEEYEHHLNQAKEKIISLILKWEEAAREKGLDQSFVGVLIFGGWARGEVHSKSDLDIWLIRKADEGDGDESVFVDQLKESGLNQIHWGSLNFSVLASPADLAWTINGGVLAEGFIVVTPYDWVADEIIKAQSPSGKAQAEMWQSKIDKSLQAEKD